MVLPAARPHCRWRQLRERGTLAGGSVLRHGESGEVELCRLVSGAVFSMDRGGRVDGQ